jgi:hypothetical protein
MQQEYGQEVIEELVDLWGVDMELEPEWFEKSYEYYSWCVGYMRERQRLISDDFFKIVDSDTSKIATG